MKAFARRFLRNTSGATALEYGLIGAFVSIAIILAATQIGGGMKLKYEQVETEVAR